MDQSYSLFTLIFKGVHEPFGFRVLYWMEYILAKTSLRKINPSIATKINPFPLKKKDMILPAYSK